MAASTEREAWSLDQLTKSQFFHAKLHEWGMLEIAAQIEAVKGEELSWEWDRLGISERAWGKVIHRGIKPVVVFASEPDIAICLEDSIAVAVEIKSGLDPAGVLERITVEAQSSGNKCCPVSRIGVPPRDPTINVNYEQSCYPWDL